MLDYDREAPRYDATRGGDARADAAAGAIETLISAGLAVGEAAGLAVGATAGLAVGEAARFAVGEAARFAVGEAARFAVGQTRIADVGCGTGIVTLRLARAGRSVIGIDRSAGMAAVAAGRLPGRITLGNVTRIPLGDRSVDVVTMVWLLHLLRAKDVAAAVAEAGRVLRPGGLLITTVGKNDAAFGGADDAAAIVGPVRARFDFDQTDRLDRVLAVGGGHGLALAAQATFAGVGQGLSPRRWRTRLRADEMPWTAAAGPERIDAVRAELAKLPDQDRARPDPVYRLAALRKD